LHPNGPSIEMSGKSIMFGTVGNATAISRPSFETIEDTTTKDDIFPSPLLA
jgi:hypothetical protein